MSCNCNPTTTTSGGTCTAGAAVCDERYANLPTAQQIKLIGTDGECLANLSDGSCGLLWIQDGHATLTTSPCSDVQSLLAYLTDEGTLDGLARVDGNLIEGTPPVFNHLLVLKDGCGTPGCGGAPSWYKWRGAADTSGFVFWNGESFSFTEVNAQGVVTSAILDPLSGGYIAAYPEATDPTTEGTKTQGYLIPDNDDLYVVDATGVANQLNAAQETGFVYYGATDACDATVIPQVINLCDITTPPCVDKPVPTKIIGCADDGAPASTNVTASLPTGFCDVVVANPGGGGAWINAYQGATFFTGNYGVLQSDTARTGSYNVTVSSSALSGAAGYTLPTGISHIVVHVRIALTTDALVRQYLSATVGGIGVAELTGISWDAGTTEDLQIANNTTIVPVSGTGSVAIDVNHSPSANSNYDLVVYLVGAYSCAQAEA